MTPSPTPAPSLQARSAPPTSPAALLRAFFTHRDLIWQMTKREVIGRYRGSAMGLLWSFFHPILMLAVYTFAFSYVLRIRLSHRPDESMIDFAIWAFAGLVLFGLFQEVIVRSPLLILQNTSYVKRIIFPLEIFPFIAVGSALIHTAMSMLVLIIAHAVFHQAIHPTLLYAPIIILPLIFIILGLSWFLASLGVFLRDVAQAIGIITMVLLYLSPVFFRIDIVRAPELQWVLLFNPLTIPIENLRRVLLEGLMPQWPALGIYTLVSLLIAWLGFAWFQRTKRGFADVI